MHHRIVVIAILLEACLSTSALAATRYVSKTRPPGEFVYRTFRAAYDEASTGDIIELDSELFPETPGEFSPEKVVTIVPRSPSARSVVFSEEVPANDAFAGRFTLRGSNVTVSGFNYLATRESGERIDSTQTGKTLWWRWVAPTTQGVVISTEHSEIETVLGVFSGTSFPLTGVSVSTPSLPIQRAMFEAAAGTEYQISVDGYLGAAGSIALELMTFPVPANDSFAQRTSLTGLTPGIRGYNYGATTEPGESAVCSLGSKSVWYSWQASVSGPAEVTLVPPYSALRLAVFTGDALSNLQTVTLSPAERESVVRFSATQGETYQMAVVGQDGATAEFLLAISPGINPPPANDNYLDAAPIAGTTATVFGDNTFATAEGDEWRTALGHTGEQCRTMGRTIWWRLDAPEDGELLIDSSQTPFSHILEAFVGPTLCQRQRIAAACMDLSPPFEFGLPQPIELFHFPVQSGRSYVLGFDSTIDTLRGNEAGSATLQITLIPRPENDHLGNATPISGNWGRFTVTNIAATREATEPASPFGSIAAGRSVWWTWNAPASPISQRPVRISTAGSDVDTLLTVYRQEPSGLLVLVASNNDESASNFSSRVQFVPHAGTTYLIGVDGNTNRANGYPPDSRKFLRHYAGEVRLTLDYSTVDLSSRSSTTNVCQNVAEASDISGTLAVTNFGTAITRPLRVRLVAVHGYTRTMAFPAGEPTTLYLNFTLDFGSLMPGTGTLITYNRVCFPGPEPDDTVADDAEGRKGWGVFATLEEEFLGTWLTIDSAWIHYGSWPRVLPFGGPNGGVIRSDPSNPKPKVLSYLAIDGPSGICTNQSVTYSAYAVFTDFSVTNAAPRWVSDSRFVTQTNETGTSIFVRIGELLPGTHLTIAGMLEYAGDDVTVTNAIVFRGDCPSVGIVPMPGTPVGNAIMAIHGIPGRRHSIDGAESLDTPTIWHPVTTNIMPSSGIFYFTNRIDTLRRNYFLRARELP